MGKQTCWLRLNEGRKKLGSKGIGTLEDVEITCDNKFIRCGESNRQNFYEDFDGQGEVINK